MKFAELKAVCAANHYIIHATDADGRRHTEEINLFETVDCYRKLGQYDDAELVRFTAKTGWWDDDIIAVLEVELRV